VFAKNKKNRDAAKIKELALGHWQTTLQNKNKVSLLRLCNVL
jgi:hypothetical protein